MFESVRFGSFWEVLNACWVSLVEQKNRFEI
jgi:hypothetical protein